MTVMSTFAYLKRPSASTAEENLSLLLGCALSLSGKEFGLLEELKDPMPDASHAKNAKACASQMEHQGKLSAVVKKKIDAKTDRILRNT